MSSVGAEMFRMLKQDVQDPEWAHRLRACIPRVHELFATLSGVLHPPADEHRLTVKINRPVVKKLKKAIARIWACLLPILTQHRYIDGDDEELHQHVESAFTTCMERLVSYVILRTLGTKDDITDHREKTTLQTALAYVAKLLTAAVTDRFTTNIHGIELTYDDLVEAMQCRSILDPRQPTAWTIAPTQQGGMFFEWGWKLVACLVVVIFFLLYRSGPVRTRLSNPRSEWSGWDNTREMNVANAPNVASPCDDARFIIGHSGMRMVPHSSRWNELDVFENRSAWIVNYNPRGDYATDIQERAFLDVISELLQSGEDELMKSALLNPHDEHNIRFIEELVNAKLNNKPVTYSVTPPGTNAPFMTYTMTCEDEDGTGFSTAGVYTLDGIKALCRNLTYESWYPIRNVGVDELITVDRIERCYTYALHPTPEQIRRKCGIHPRTIRKWASDIEVNFQVTSDSVLHLRAPFSAYHPKLVVYNLGCRSIGVNAGRVTRNRGIGWHRFASSRVVINQELERLRKIARLRERNPRNHI